MPPSRRVFVQDLAGLVGPASRYRSGRRKSFKLRIHVARCPYHADERAKGAIKLKAASSPRQRRIRVKSSKHQSSAMSCKDREYRDSCYRTLGQQWRKRGGGGGFAARPSALTSACRHPVGCLLLLIGGKRNRRGNRARRENK